MRFDWSLRGGSCYDGIFLVLAMDNLQKSGNSKRTFPLLFGYWWCCRFMLHFRLHRLDMWHGRIIMQPLHATNWMSVVQKLQSLCWYSYYATGETGYVLYSASVDADGHKRDPLLGLRYKEIVTLRLTYINLAIVWVVCLVAGLFFHLDYRITFR